MSHQDLVAAHRAYRRDHASCVELFEHFLKTSNDVGPWELGAYFAAVANWTQEHEPTREKLAISSEHLDALLWWWNRRQALCRTLGFVLTDTEIFFRDFLLLEAGAAVQARVAA